MAAKRHRNWDAAGLLQRLMADRGWYAIDVARSSEEPGHGHPLRSVSERTVYRITNDGYVPRTATQFEIAAVFGLLPSHIWGSARLPEPYDHLNAREQVAA